MHEVQNKQSHRLVKINKWKHSGWLVRIAVLQDCGYFNCPKLDIVLQFQNIQVWFWVIYFINTMLIYKKWLVLDFRCQKWPSALSFKRKGSPAKRSSWWSFWGESFFFMTWFKLLRYFYFKKLNIFSLNKIIIITGFFGAATLVPELCGGSYSKGIDLSCIKWTQPGRGEVRVKAHPYTQIDACYTAI